MRSPEQQAKLDAMTPEEKYERTRYENMIERQSPILKGEHSGIIRWAIFHNEFPHEDRCEQLVLWIYGPTRHWALSGAVMDVFSQYVSQGYHIHRHPIQDQSVPQREHWHIYKPITPCNTTKKRDSNDSAE